MPFNLKNRHFLTIHDFSQKEVLYLLDLARDLKRAKYAGTEVPRLRGKNVALIFEKDSTRTRCAFEVACYDQGANVTYLGPCVEPEALIRAVRERRPVAVGLSVALAPHMREVERLIQALREALGDGCPPLFVGGRAFSGDPEAWRRVGADAYSRDAEGAVALLDRQLTGG